MSSGIRGSLPEGHEGYRKPAIACGDKGWKLYKPDDEDPNDASEPKRKLRETRPNMSERGAWHWRQRWIRVGDMETTEQSVNFCSNGVSGLTLLGDLIIFCDRALNSKGYPKPAAQVKQRLGSGVSVNTVSWDLRLTSTMIHEFSHYFGSVWDKEKKQYTLSSKLPVSTGISLQVSDSNLFFCTQLSMCPLLMPREELSKEMRGLVSWITFYEILLFDRVKV